MGKPVALVTGAGGEMGHLLVPALAERGLDVVAFDLRPLPGSLRSACRATGQIDLLDAEQVARALGEHRPSYVFHLAAVLSSHAELNWLDAHRINVEGTLQLYRLCLEPDTEPVRFLFPSSIAVYGLPDAATKDEAGAVREWCWTTPRSIYGCTKLYCETVGSYLAARERGRFDFRAIRFPGLISADTLPTGGTTDYAPQMIHAAAQHKPYTGFVRASSRLPFMTMPDAIDTLLRLATADEARLARRVYNARGFACSAGEIRDEVVRHFPRATIDFEVEPRKQALVDSWPADVDDTPARTDWDHAPRHGLAQAFGDYLLPALERRYAPAG